MRAIVAVALAASACVANSTDTLATAEQDSTVCGAGTTVTGVDVSKWDGTIDWDTVKQTGVAFAFVRVSDGLNSPDATFATNWAATRSAGIIHGAYQFFEPAQDPIAQADMLLSKMGPMQDDDLPPVIDVEVSGGLSSAGVAAAVTKWVTHVTAAIGRPPIIYTGYYFWQDNVGGIDLTSSPLWHAQYTTAACPNIASPWTTWAFWQYTDTGSIGGISDAVDIDEWNGDMTSLQAFLGPPGACGDGTCSASETSSSCPEDCGPCGEIDATSGLVIDNGDACFIGGGPSDYLRQITGHGYNDDLIWTHTTAYSSEENFATWSLYFDAPGNYQVEAYTSASYAQSTQAKYVVAGDGAPQNVIVDQTAVDGWQTLGVFAFDAGGHQTIHLGDNTGEPGADDVQLVFDAVRITPSTQPVHNNTLDDVDGGGGGSDGGGPGPGGGSKGAPISGIGTDVGCSAGGGASSGGLVGLALVGLCLRRRRRA